MIAAARAVEVREGVAHVEQRELDAAALARARDLVAAAAGGDHVAAGAVRPLRHDEEVRLLRVGGAGGGLCRRTERA